ncbi:type II toxin-antitoxin system VapC family toxin [Sphingobacterium phlebotomi]|uniref:Type II toxin-antitoxin system VapC family toxin n=1 Tax=Sphingobacterium phlebotomi TaxID=2605433 RepID=A0A5D4H9Z5_9SPHI|nr:type II toxin-antitoxin system VapC family toxin [Sphingobacterium phlebotomi]TYR37447.1 type II toxin-antitoxin system VapC family toxin [Sphingobacterium phlebotomi]
MGTGYLIDTNVLIDAQMDRLPAESKAFLAKIIDENFTISFVTYIEYLGFKGVSKMAEQFIKLADVIEIDKSIIDTCIDLRKKHTIKLPDAIIAATALAKKLTLLTRNTADFKGIKGLKLINPWEI